LDFYNGENQRNFGASNVSFDLIDKMLKKIEGRNREAMNKLYENKKELESKFDKMIRFISFRNKVDKLETAYSLIFIQVQIKQMNILTKKPLVTG